MKYVILCGSKRELNDVITKAGIKDSSGNKLTLYDAMGEQTYVKVDADGYYDSWQSNYPNSDFNQYFSEALAGDTELVLASSILNGDYTCPWIAVVDEKHPPKGYRFITPVERKNTLKPKNAICWDSCDKAWRASAWGGFWCDKSTYAIKTDTKLQSKEVEMTMTEVCKALGKQIKIIEG